MNAEESVSEAWVRLVQHYQASGLEERQSPTFDLYMITMQLGEHPRKFLLCVDQMMKELEQVYRLVDAKDFDIVILRGRTS